MAKPNVNTLTAERARELLRYDPESGKVYWRLNTGRWGRIHAGSEAGSIDADRYWRVHIEGRQYYTHRLVWLIVTGAWPTDQLDHIDGDGLNNRWHNLRAATNQVNRRNQKRRITNTSGITGVHWDGVRRKWRAQIQVAGTNIQLGRFDDLPSAVEERKLAERRYGFHENHGRSTSF